MSGIHAMLLGGTTGGGGSGSVTLNNATVDAVGTYSAGWRLDSDGHVYTAVTPTYSSQYQWTTDSTANYEVRATLVSGAVSTGTTGSWLACSSDRTWTTSTTDIYSILTIEVRDAVTTTVLASCTVSLNAPGTL